MRAFHLLVAIWMKESAIDLCSIEILMQSNLSVICDREWRSGLYYLWSTFSVSNSSILREFSLILN
ncbi:MULTISPECIES: hypothetical protein [unclassified Microcoleus]|uniref:hypothetical protein n=1 Tax=unclassified Microcoleus TaxID=2642155 RepID=UPI0025D389A1|nr:MULTISPECIES: hypothetical protein [unclassified Microcoleus]